MKKRPVQYLTWICAIGCVSLAGSMANAADLTVHIEDMDSDAGQVVIAIFNSDEHFLKQPVREDSVQPQNNEVVFSFKDITPGEYAISVFHDRNENGKLDTNFLGIPNEPFGFSNNPKVLFGPPSFQKSKVSIFAPDTFLDMQLNSF